MTLTRRTALATGVAAAACACAPAKLPAAPLRFSVLASESSSALSAKWTPLLRDLSARLGRDIRPFYAAAYSPLVEAMRFRQTELGWFSNLSGLEAVNRAGGEVFAHTTHPGGKQGYNSVVIVRKGGGLTLERLLACDRTLSFGMGDASSTSGTLAPHAYLFGPRGIDPQACFRAVRSANHETNLLAVANGVVDAATNNTTDMERMAMRRSPEMTAALARVEVVWASPTLPEDPMIWRRDLDPALKRAIRNALLAYGRGPDATRELAVLRDLNFGPFEPADDRHLLVVRELKAADALMRAKRAGDAAAAHAAQSELDAVRSARGAKAA